MRRRRGLWFCGGMSGVLVACGCDVSASPISPSFKIMTEVLFLLFRVTLFFLFVTFSSLVIESYQTCRHLWSSLFILSLMNRQNYHQNYGGVPSSGVGNVKTGVLPWDPPLLRVCIYLSQCHTSHTFLYLSQ